MNAELKPRSPLSNGMRGTLRDCADSLDRALAMRISHMDSASRVEGIQKEQREAIQAVARTLRDLA